MYHKPIHVDGKNNTKKKKSQKLTIDQDFVDADFNEHLESLYPLLTISSL